MACPRAGTISESLAFSQAFILYIENTVYIMSSLIEDNRANALLQIKKAHLNTSMNERVSRERMFLQTFFSPVMSIP